VFHPLGRGRLLSAAVLSWVALATCFAPRARAEGMVTDRPDFVEASEVVGPHRVQIEAGLDFDREDAAGVRKRGRSTPMLLRIGLGDRFELRVETDGALRQEQRDPATGLRTRETGIADTALGVKWHRQDGDEGTGRPSTAWLLHVELPTGDREFRGPGWRPSLRYVAEWDLPDDVSIGVMPGVLLDQRPLRQRHVRNSARQGPARRLAWFRRTRGAAARRAPQRRQCVHLRHRRGLVGHR
jgi:hypothetical protein